MIRFCTDINNVKINLLCSSLYTHLIHFLEVELLSLYFFLKPFIHIAKFPSRKAVPVYTSMNDVGESFSHIDTSNW